MADDRDNVLAAEQRRCEALIAKDEAALNALFTDDFVYVHSSGRKEGKGTYVSTMVATPNPFVSFDHDDLKVEILGDVALMTGIVSIKRQDNAVVFLSAELWVRSAGGWRLKYQHNTKKAG